MNNTQNNKDSYLYKIETLGFSTFNQTGSRAHWENFK